jgi:hypothetical protein
MTRVTKIAAAAGILALAAGFSTEARRADGVCERRDADQVVALEGKVMETEDRMALFQADGKTYLLHMGPRWFWDEHAYALEAKDRLRVTGQVSGTDAGNLNLYPHTIERNGETYTLADADGRPAWARGGRGRGAGARAGDCEERGRGSCGRGPGRGRGPSGPGRG